jgi:hypothetical protein
VDTRIARIVAGGFSDYGAFMSYAVAVIGLLAVAGAALAKPLPPTATSVRPFVVGTWSFDGSCASGDGMRLELDGKASYDEWGRGLWALANYDTQIAIIAEDISEYSDRRQEAQLIELRIVARQGNAMTLVRQSDGATINAVRCGVK